MRVRIVLQLGRILKPRIDKVKIFWYNLLKYRKGANNLEDYSNIQDLLQLEDIDPDLDTEDVAPEQEAAAIENDIEEAHISQTLRLDYKLKTCEERARLVERIIETTPEAHLTNRYLEILGDYIMGGLSKEEKKEKLYLTDNRMLTVNKRETSWEGMVEKFENGEDGIYNLITNDKNILFQPRDVITEEEVDKIPGLRALRDAMKEIEEQGKAATGRKKYLLKKALIEMRRDQYILKSSYKPTAFNTPRSARGGNKIDLTEERYIDKDGNPQSKGLISFFNPEHVSALLRYYNALKLETQGRYQNDFFYLLEDFDKLFNKALQNYPMYRDIAIMKMNDKSNLEIQQMLIKKYNIKHTVQYISKLWRSTIPKLIAEKEQNDYLIWYYSNIKEGKWKKCSKCHEYKLASPRFFSRNNTSKDGFYCQCKECRNQKNRAKENN